MFSGSIVALVTPFNEANQIDEAAWLGLLDWHAQAGTAGVVVAGTTGESASLTGDEFARLLRAAVDRLGGRLAVLAGTGSPSTAATIEKTRLAAELGADAALVVTPAYVRPTQRGLLAHFRAVAEDAALPIVLYNVPTRTACDLQPETSLQLAANPRIVAIKEAVGDRARVAALVAGGMRVLSGDDPSCCERMIEGAAGVISVAANVAPQALADMCRRIQDGRVDQARAINARLRPLFEFLAVEPNPVPVKWLMSRMGRVGSRIRLPLVDLAPGRRAAAESLLELLALDAVGNLA